MEDEKKGTRLSRRSFLKGMGGGAIGTGTATTFCVGVAGFVPIPGGRGCPGASGAGPFCGGNCCCGGVC